MVTIDNSLGETAGIDAGWWRHPRVLTASLALAGGLAVAAAVTVGLSAGWFAGEKGAAYAAVSDEVTPASASVDGAPPQACARMQQIVRTACGYRQHDHDPASIRQCIAYELKYTMWSAYGCQ